MFKRILDIENPTELYLFMTKIKINTYRTIYNERIQQQEQSKQLDKLHRKHTHAYTLTPSQIKPCNRDLLVPTVVHLSLTL